MSQLLTNKSLIIIQRILLALIMSLVSFTVLAQQLPDKRPQAPTFSSQAVENYIKQQQSKISSSDLSQLFANTFAYTLDHTVFQSNVDQQTDLAQLQSYLVTGDIKAMWIRDSSNQAIPYLFLIAYDQRLFKLLVGLVNVQSQFLTRDPFANAFEVPNGDPSPHTSDQSYSQYWEQAMLPGIFERKFEVDSFAAFFKLQRLLIANSSNAQREALKPVIQQQWMPLTEKITQLIQAWMGDFSQLSDPENPFFYYFTRAGASQLDTLVNGVGIASKANGMVRILFRPSDDVTSLPLNLPINFMLAYELKALAKQYQDAALNCAASLCQQMSSLADTIVAAIKANGIDKNDQGNRYNYEIDGFGQQLFIDDANYPSLLSLPYSAPGIFDPQIYLNTRKQLLNTQSNPWYFSGSNGVHGGIGSPHTGKDRIWPLSLIIQARTSNDPKEISDLLNALIASAEKTGLLHESYSSSDYTQITRDDFAWGNAAFAELVIWISEKYPDLILKERKTLN